MFLTNEINAAGCYAVKLWHNGEFVSVVIDDRLPYGKLNQNELLYAKSKANALWVPFLEKTWAKLNHNSYENTINGNPYEAFKALTGAPILYLKHKNSKNLWNEI